MCALYAVLAMMLFLFVIAVLWLIWSDVALLIMFDDDESDTNGSDQRRGTE